MPRFIPTLTGVNTISGSDIILIYRNNLPYNTTYGVLYTGIINSGVALVDKTNITGNTTIHNGTLTIGGNLFVNSGNFTVSGVDGRSNVGYSNTFGGSNLLGYGHFNTLSGSDIGVFGKNNFVTGDSAVSIGYTNHFGGTRVVNVGLSNILTTGKDVFVFGYNNTIAYNNTGVLVFGDNNKINAFRAYTHGSENIISGDDCVVVGLRNTLVSGSNPSVLERADIFGRSNLVSGGTHTSTFGGFNCQYGSLSYLYGNLLTNYASGTLSFGTGNTLSGTATGSMNIGFGIVTILPNVIEIGLNNTGKITIDAYGNLTVTGSLNYNGTLTFLNGNFAGSGSPEGIVTATPGARYLDTGWGPSYTGHLMTWVKWSGNGAAGWA